MESMTEEQHIFNWKDCRLFAIWHHSNASDPPLVILHHGFNGNKIEEHRIFVKLARRLAKEGVDAFRFDFYGSGDSEGSLSDATLSTWIANSIEAASYVRGKGRQNIILLGFSLGGFVVAAAAPSIGPSGIVLWAPIFHPLKRILQEKSLIAEGRKKGYADLQGEVIRLTIVKDAARFKIPNAFSGYKAPVLLLHGSEDTNALPSESAQYKEFYGKQGVLVELRVVEGANHSFDRHDWEAEAIEQSCQWIHALLNKGTD